MQSIPNFDYAMAPGVDKSFKKNFKNALIEALAIDVGLDEAKEYVNTLEMPTISTYKSWQKDNELISKYLEIVGKLAYEKTEKDTYQAMEGLIHNLNTMSSRAGAQVPFSSLNFGTDTSAEGRMVIKNLLLATESGLGNGETAIFPVSIFKVKEGINFNQGDPNYDLFKLAIRVSAKRLFPNFSFLDSPFNLAFYKEGDYNTEVAYMG